MNQKQLINFIAEPAKINNEDISLIEQVLTKFPYFQSAHMLLTLASKKHNSALFQQTVKKTAIAIPNRARLYDLVHSFDNKNSENSTSESDPKQDVKTDILENKPGYSEIEQLQKIEIKTQEKISEEELNNQVEKEIEKQIVTAFVEKEILKTSELHKKELAKKQEITSGSFTDWLSHINKNVVEKTEQSSENSEKPAKDKKAEQKLIIDKIIEKNPGNIRFNTTTKFYTPEQAKESLIENEDLVTETLAKIYALQGNISKAIRAYEILSLKFPQKNAYFASLIENLKKDN